MKTLIIIMSFLSCLDMVIGIVYHCNKTQFLKELFVASTAITFIAIVSFVILNIIALFALLIC